MARAIDLDKAIEIIEEKQKELCPVGRYGRNYVYGSDREKYDDWEEIIDALENLPTLTPTNEPLTLEELREMDGEPVWVDTMKRWGIVRVCGYGISVLTKSGEYDVTRMKFYRRPPEGEED